MHDAQVWIAHAIKQPVIFILTHPEKNLTDEEIAAVEIGLRRLEQGEPLPYLLGHWEFYELDLDITKDVLIPRPETELLVEKAITWLQNSPERRTVADIGTGSGAIAVTLAMQVPDARILATDISCAALKIAKHNAEKFHVHHQIDFLQCDLLPQYIDPLPTESHFDLICANLPYIPTETFINSPSLAVNPPSPLMAAQTASIFIAACSNSHQIGSPPTE